MRMPLPLSLAATTLVVAGGTAVALAAAPSATAEVPPPVTHTFAWTGGEQTFTVPAGITSVSVVAVGARGGNGIDNVNRQPYSSLGGAGDQVQGEFAVTPGQSLYVEVGGAGERTGAGGFNGGGNGGAASPHGAGGGGASDVRTVARDVVDSLASRLIVAAGGGGGGAGDSNDPLSTGGAGGNAGTAGGDADEVTGGGAGTASAGGLGGASSGQWASGPGQDGSLGEGGTGGGGADQYGTQQAGAGGGGGGLYGGGGGGDTGYAGAGGGGGSDLVPDGGSASSTTDPASVTISYQPGPAATVEVSAAPTTILADGTSAATITALVTDANGTPIPGLMPGFTSSDSGDTFGSVTDHGDGTYSAPVSASHAGTATVTVTVDSVSGTAQLTQRAPRPPRIVAHVTSQHRKSRYGWYRNPVTVSFTCTPGTAALTGPCPGPVARSANGRHTITRTISGVDQRTGRVAIQVNIDRTTPHVRVLGATNGGTYRSARHLRCSAHDGVSGVAHCALHSWRHRSGKVTVVRYVARARDRAGNARTVTGRYRIR